MTCVVFYMYTRLVGVFMKKTLSIFLILAALISLNGCVAPKTNTDIVVTTKPIYDFTIQLCQGTGISVECLITENISCLHDYTLQTKQMRAIENAEIVIISGAGLEEVFSDVLQSANAIIDASAGVKLLCSKSEHAHVTDEHTHAHKNDPHIWLSPKNAAIMVNNISEKLSQKYPQHKELLEKNRLELIAQLDQLLAYGESALSNISTREIITFHDGFGYMADAFGLHVLHAIEEESGREASAEELIYLCNVVNNHNLPCIFIEKNGSVSAAKIISAETGAKLYSLDMAMSSDYFNAMYHNIDTLKEALK